MEMKHRLSFTPNHLWNNTQMDIDETKTEPNQTSIEPVTQLAESYLRDWIRKSNRNGLETGPT